MPTVFDKCNRCGKDIGGIYGYSVRCKHTQYFEHDTERYLCQKCYEKFSKYIEKQYNKFFTYLIELERGEE